MAIVKQTAGREALGDFAPEFAHLNDDVLFGEVWSRQDRLSAKLRSIATISGLIGKGILDSSLEYHLKEGKKNGISKDEMAELLTHLAFYCGWPNAWAAFKMAKAVYADGDLETHGGFFGLGKPNDAYASYFTGKSYLKPVLTEGVNIANVTFEPGCRNHWHSHTVGQVLIGVDGLGWIQLEGKDPIAMRPGTVVYVPANTRHWHGASKDSWFSHLAFFDAPNGKTHWGEPVSDAQYDALGKEGEK